MKIDVQPLKESTGARSLRRAIEILGLIESKGRGLSVSEIVGELSLPRSTAYEIVRVLLETRLLAQEDSDAKFKLGARLFELGMHYRSHDRLLQEGSRILAALRDETGETVQLSILDGDRVNIVLKEEGRRAVRIISDVGSRVPVNWSAAGRLLVSDLGDVELKKFLERTIAQSPTGQAEMNVPNLMGQIRAYRKRGYSTETNEANEHAGCIAAPVLNDTQSCIAAISLAAPESRLKSEDFERLKSGVQSAANQLSASLYPA
ncbi:IclR family transcriptional regulator [Agrobacterium tumefaciens]|uniref:IclR family transcriptional regulator n=1 Tax=Agrobacterium tumefaciens TaxID=358 RepID=UPI001573C5AF|nr:IclR family transcriptional regulator [Agrobacterium tumefaciens]NTE68193.1 IclR family transcriptional regulator [Agrobacterium tumefaciens]